MFDYNNQPDFGALLAEQTRTTNAILDLKKTFERLLINTSRGPSAPPQARSAPPAEEQLAPEWTRDPRWQTMARRAWELRHEIGKADHPSVGFLGNLVEKFSHQPRLSEKQGRWLASIAAQLGIEPRE